MTDGRSVGQVSLPSGAFRVCRKSSRPTTAPEVSRMTQKMYKCFVCGKMYKDEQRAIDCHKAPVQQVLKRDDLEKPKFLGN